MVQQVRVCTALTEDPNSVLNIHVMDHLIAKSAKKCSDPKPPSDSGRVQSNHTAVCAWTEDWVCCGSKANQTPKSPTLLEYRVLGRMYWSHKVEETPADHGRGQHVMERVIVASVQHQYSISTISTASAPSVQHQYSISTISTASVQHQHHQYSISTISTASAPSVVQTLHLVNLLTSC
ncbi:hypothetical protein STEG23_004746 [Scotinomys teguina]